ncbi:hypothetical protein J2753_001723 [Halolamina salifodinae]|uniref:Uncharacterized protein n=1 Tax=Halolamina salifodinae TaxID=1202767 RepID=A0A8T4H0X6_9EURY|nr:hypothetical protein [Halolamina salifodinae]
MVYNAMCLPGGEMAALGVGLLVTAILISIIYVRNE